MVDQEDIERRVDFIVRELDEFCALTMDPKTRALIHNERIGIGQILTRAQLVTSFLNPPKFKAPQNGETIQRNHGLHGAAQDRQRRDLGSSR